ncbi:Uncharacterised protein [Mycobacteroides abscessus subsp. abscessus]|nr:Uncharacterised protein [Mycobacteroides abscessus subsp. abscessus]
MTRPTWASVYSFRKMIALLRAGRLLDEAIVLDEVGIPVVGLTAEKAVVPVEALL